MDDTKTSLTVCTYWHDDIDLVWDASMYVSMDIRRMTVQNS